MFELGDVPRPPGVKKLRGTSQWRIRVGEYRIMYSISDMNQWIVVERIERRTTHTYD
jgi:mRNA interferase RelE/StbE